MADAGLHRHQDNMPAHYSISIGYFAVDSEKPTRHEAVLGPFQPSGQRIATRGMQIMLKIRSGDSYVELFNEHGFYA